MLRARGDPRRLQPVDERGPGTSDEARRVSERTHSDHGVRRVGVHVDDRRQRYVDPRAASGLANAPGNGTRRVDVVDLPQSGMTRPWRTGRRIEPRYGAALLVTPDQRALAGRVDLVGERARTAALGQIVREPAHSAQTCVQLTYEPLGRAGAEESRNQHGVDEPTYGWIVALHSFTP